MALRLAARLLSLLFAMRLDAGFYHGGVSGGGYFAETAESPRISIGE